MNSEEKAFLITSSYEGAGYIELTGNFDGQGFSFGVICFNLGKNTLQPLIRAMYQAGPETFKKCCTVKVASAPYNGAFVDLSNDLLAVCNEMTPEQAVKWAEARQDGNHRPMQHWSSVFHNLGSEPGFQAIQRKFAKPYMDKAKKYMSEFGFVSERALALLYDICVQMGSVKIASLQRYRNGMKPGMLEQERLVLLAQSVAPQAGRWSSDGLSRKMAIAKGTGKVHGRYYDMAKDFGLTDQKAF